MSDEILAIARDLRARFPRVLGHLRDAELREARAIHDTVHGIKVITGFEMETSTMMADESRQGAGEPIDPLPLLAAVADDMADVLLRFFTQEEYRVERPEFERMRQVQRVLMLNAHPVPRNVDAVVEAARAHGGLPE